VRPDIQLNSGDVTSTLFFTQMKHLLAYAKYHNAEIH